MYVCMYVYSLDDEPTLRTAMLVQFGRDPDGPRVNLTYLGGPIVTLDGIPIRSRSMRDKTRQDKTLDGIPKEETQTRQDNPPRIQLLASQEPVRHSSYEEITANYSFRSKFIERRVVCIFPSRR